MTEATTKRRSRRLYVRNIDGRDEEMVTLSSYGESVSVKVGLLQGLVTLDEVSELRKQAQKEKGEPTVQEILREAEEAYSAGNFDHVDYLAQVGAHVVRWVYGKIQNDPGDGASAFAGLIEFVPRYISVTTGAGFRCPTDFGLNKNATAQLPGSTTRGNHWGAPCWRECNHQRHTEMKARRDNSPCEYGHSWAYCSRTEWSRALSYVDRYNSALRKS